MRIDNGIDRPDNPAEIRPQFDEMFAAAMVPRTKIDVADLCVLNVVKRAVEDPIRSRGDVAPPAVACLSEG
jgi:hypothetical protein